MFHAKAQREQRRKGNAKLKMQNAKLGYPDFAFCIFNLTFFGG
jgi:hypothetical protein